MKKVDDLVNAIIKEYNIEKIITNTQQEYVYFTIFIKNKRTKIKEGLRIKYPLGLIEGLVFDELLRRFEHLIDLKLLESYKLEV